MARDYELLRLCEGAEAEVGRAASILQGIEANDPNISWKLRSVIEALGRALEHLTAVSGQGTA